MKLEKMAKLLNDVVITQGGPYTDDRVFVEGDKIFERVTPFASWGEHTFEVTTLEAATRILEGNIELWSLFRAVPDQVLTLLADVLDILKDVEEVKEQDDRL